MNRYSDVTDELCQVSCIHPEKVRHARSGLPETEELRRQAEYFRLLGEPTRLRLIHALASGELCVCDLSTLLEASPSAVSHQLRLLRTAGLVRYRKEGKMVYYALDDAPLRELLSGSGLLCGARGDG